MGVIMTNDDCQNAITELKSKYKGFLEGLLRRHLPQGLTDSVLCTHGICARKDDYGECVYTAPCSGDGGAPLYINTEINDNGDFSGQILAAINAGGRSCGSFLEPSFWNRISNHRDWILCVQEKTKEKLPVSECDSLATDNPCSDSNSTQCEN